MERRNTIQKSLVLQAVFELKRHLTADEVYEFVRESYPSIGKGTVYRNLAILSEEGAIRRVEIPDGPDRFDFTLKKHYHMRCIRCGNVADVDLDEIPELEAKLHDSYGMKLLEYDILFKGICAECAARSAEE